MPTLSELEPGIGFCDLEPLICDAADMVDAFNAIVHQHFDRKPAGGRFILTADEGHRLFFLAGMAVAMSEKVKEAYYAAWENEAAARGVNKQAA